MQRPAGQADFGTSAPWQQQSTNPSGWHSDQPDPYSSYQSSENFGGSAAMPWAPPNKPNDSTFTNQSSGTFGMPNQFPANQSAMSGYQQQTSQTSQGTSGMPRPVEGVQPPQTGDGAYGWNSDVSAGIGQWQNQTQWQWPQANTQWPSNQPFQYMVRYSRVYVCACLSILLM